jgi:hypothetical protein
MLAVDIGEPEVTKIYMGYSTLTNSNWTPEVTMEILVSAGIFQQSMEARNRVGIGLSYQPARLHRLAE